jgi:hypothetical protein
MNNRRIVLSTKENLTFTGIERDRKCIEEENGILVELDADSGLKLWCPQQQIESILEVKIAGNNGASGS